MPDMMFPVIYILLNTQRNNNTVVIQAYTCLQTLPILWNNLTREATEQAHTDSVETIKSLAMLKVLLS